MVIQAKELMQGYKDHVVSVPLYTMSSGRFRREFPVRLVLIFDL